MTCQLILLIIRVVYEEHATDQVFATDMKDVFRKSTRTTEIKDAFVRSTRTT